MNKKNMCDQEGDRLVWNGVLSVETCERPRKSTCQKGVFQIIQYELEVQVFHLYRGSIIHTIFFSTIHVKLPWILCLGWH